MNIVWIAIKGWEYEGSDVIGVFVDKESAITHCRTDYKTTHGIERELNFTAYSESGESAEDGSLFYHVEKWEVQS